MKAVINSVKHIVQKSLDLITEQTVQNIPVAITVTTEPTTPASVVVGSIIKAIYLEYWLLGEGSQPTTATWSLEKLPNSGTPMSQVDSQNLHDYPNKANLFKIGQGIVGDANANPIPVVREWITIPKGKQRMAQGDLWNFNISAVGEAQAGVEICGLAIYKEYQ